MRITVLVNNEANESFLNEHGLSLYIEYNNKKILFDTGQTDIFIKNSKKLGIDLSNVDYLIISHGHYDHGGGINSFLNINSKAKILINENAFGKYYNALDKYIGLNVTINDRFILTNDKYEIGNIKLFTLNNCITSDLINPYGLTKMINSKKILDDFRHEQFLMLDNVLISGCSHKGIINILNNCININTVIGGFHLNKETDENVKAIALKMNSYNIKYYTCHCTGIDKYYKLQEILKNKISYIKAGDILEI